MKALHSQASPVTNQHSLNFLNAIFGKFPAVSVECDSKLLHGIFSMQHTFLTSLLKGSVAGFVATVPMTIFMQKMGEKLPPKESYALPPRQITEELTDKVGLAKYMNEAKMQDATKAAHFGFGSTMGGIYGVLFSDIKGSSVVKGSAFGFAVWAGSYLKLLPALNLLSPATDHPARRNALMIGAHIVWGSFLSEAVDIMSIKIKTTPRSEAPVKMDPNQANQSFS